MEYKTHISDDIFLMLSVNPKCQWIFGFNYVVKLYLPNYICSTHASMVLFCSHEFDAPFSQRKSLQIG